MPYGHARRERVKIRYFVECFRGYFCEITVLLKSIETIRCAMLHSLHDNNYKTVNIAAINKLYELKNTTCQSRNLFI